MPEITPRTFTLEELAQLTKNPKRTYHVLLHKSSKWIDWEANALLAGDAKIMSVNPGAQWPLQISFSGSSLDTQAAPYDPKMEFYLVNR